MKLHLRPLLVAASLLVVGSAAHASAAMTPAQLPFCSATPTAPQLLNLTPGVSSPAAITFPRCGACSFSPCAGAKLNGGCGLDRLGRQAWCQDTGSNCPADGSVQCVCTSAHIA